MNDKMKPIKLLLYDSFLNVKATKSHKAHFIIPNSLMSLFLLGVNIVSIC